MSTLTSIITASFAVSSISLIGGILLLHKKKLSKKVTVYSVSFAAGVMLATSLLDLLPEALHESQDFTLFVFILFGIVTFFFLERFVLWFHHHHDDTHNTKPTAFLILVGDGFHNIFDGIAIAAAFVVNPSLGFITTMAIAAHEIPQEIANMVILIHGGMSTKKALVLNFISGLTALAGAILAFYFLKTVEGVVPYFVAFTAGMFIYISCSDLIPELHQDFKQKKAWAQSLPFIAGILLMYIMVSLLEH